jgi:hypothetical protein
MSRAPKTRPGLLPACWSNTPRFACFLPSASAHARRRAVMRNSLTELLHRMFMDTQPKDVLLLLPALPSYDAQLHTLQYPSNYWCLPLESACLMPRCQRAIIVCCGLNCFSCFNSMRVHRKVDESRPVPQPSRPAVGVGRLIAGTWVLQRYCPVARGQCIASGFRCKDAKSISNQQDSATMQSHPQGINSFCRR